MRPYLIVLAALVAAAPALAGDAGRHKPHIVGPVDAFAYRLAEPGTYGLPPIRPAPDAVLLDETGAEVRLADVFADRITVLAFIYTRCADLCPLVQLRLSELAALAEGDPVSERLTLVSLSFDPVHDTPQEMARQAAAFRPEEPDAPRWLFLTAPDVATIRPLLAAYDQPVQEKSDPADPAGPFSHLLRVFLIDGSGTIRNIYSADFLDPRLMINDVHTLAHEHHAN